ncbi:hypothetical protein EBE87_27735 [Pseudoroseomonas wenyumeiae]|uniref:Lysozyme inhibitor LprI N-terminal domain-containing protein n=1 Tax=Teichococcus wenyumeiae TaxID=2478470 RepID=A0A3A9JI44_9PROT|nr:hypothetical protein D6Z83_15200 [Pseudoroseomonas wenyumeiae]RMI14582.1 hypothetical protein EBE87_27735 [Pseudoroseomonas wenyumeiae]
MIALPVGFVALHALPVPAQAAPPAAETDAELLALCRRYMTAERRYTFLCDQEEIAQEAGQKEREARIGDLIRRAVEYQQDLLAQIVDTPARTVGGVRAKAKVCMSRVQTWATGSVMESDQPMWSLCRDLLGYDPGESAA